MLFGNGFWDKRDEEMNMLILKLGTLRLPLTLVFLLMNHEIFLKSKRNLLTSQKNSFSVLEFIKYCLTLSAEHNF